MASHGIWTNSVSFTAILPCWFCLSSRTQQLSPQEKKSKHTYFVSWPPFVSTIHAIEAGIQSSIWAAGIQFFMTVKEIQFRLLYCQHRLEILWETYHTAHGDIFNLFLSAKDTKALKGCRKANVNPQHIKASSATTTYLWPLHSTRPLQRDTLQAEGTMPCLKVFENCDTQK